MAALLIGMLAGILLDLLVHKFILRTRGPAVANLPLAFAELLVGALIIEAGVKGAAIKDVVTGQAKQAPVSGINAPAGAASASDVNAATGAGTATGSVAKGLALLQGSVGGPYSQANHDAVDKTAAELRSAGTDCSGLISAFMGPNGLGLWSSSLATPGIPSGPDLAPGQGKTVTIWNNPAAGNLGHVFIDVAGNLFESSGSQGIHQMSQAEFSMYRATGLYQPFHPNGM